MNIFESLENLNVSEECFNDIVQLVEYFISEEELDMEKVYNSGRRHYATQIKKNYLEKLKMLKKSLKKQEVRLIRQDKA